MTTYGLRLSTKQLSIIALSAAFYVLMGAITGLVLPAARGYPAHFFRGLAMSAAGAYTRRMWSVTVMSLIAGVLFMVLVPAPAPYLLFSTVAAGLLYDLSMGRNYPDVCRKRRRITMATVVSGLGEAVVALGILTYVGLFNVQPSALAVIWIVTIAANLVLSTAGAQVTVALLRRYTK
ncbi:MAG: hypothetical protein QXF36_07130 [Candidatus Caldarchaeum sp.]